MTFLTFFHLVAVFLLCIGLFGIIWRRTIVGILLSVELMLNGAGLSIMASTQLTTTANALGQVGTLLVMGLAAAEATLVLAIILVVAKRFGTIELRYISSLRG
ncbi:MAG: NADH-quinone oxidoreductase subunit NuoK [Desulfonatronovibrionaceae bacterium]